MNEQTYASDTPAAGRAWIERAATINLLLGVVFPATFVFFAVRARFTVPYIDGGRGRDAYDHR